MDSLANLFNSPTGIEFEGKTFRLRQPTLMECGEYQRQLESEARAGAARATELPDEDRRRLLRDVAADIAANRYRYGGEVCVESLRSPEGVARLMSIICREQGMTYDIALRLCDQKLRECVAIVAGELAADPKSPAVAALLASLGLPPNFLKSASPDSSTCPSEAPPTSKPSDGFPSGSSKPSTPESAEPTADTPS